MELKEILWIGFWTWIIMFGANGVGYAVHIENDGKVKKFLNEYPILEWISVFVIPIYLLEFLLIGIIVIILFFTCPIWLTLGGLFMLIGKEKK